MRSEKIIKKQLKDTTKDYEREPNSKTQGYIEALKWVLEEE